MITNEYKARLSERANGAITVIILTRRISPTGPEFNGTWGTVPNSLSVWTNRRLAEAHAHNALKLLREDEVIVTWEIE